jgi:hypothetical protein
VRYVGVLLVVLLVVFAAGVFRLFQLRFAQGDVYPPYSTFRSDPLGAKALYESLDNLPGFAVRRNFKPVDKLTDRVGQTVFFLGVPVYGVTEVPTHEAIDIEKLTTAGNRLVATILPEVVKPPAPKDKMQEREPAPDPKRKPRPTSDEEEEVIPERYRPVSLEKRWGFEVRYAYDATNTLWRTTVYFDNLDPKWRVLAKRKDYPAIIERDFGKGAVVLCADSYFVSNEALRRDRHTDLLTTILGANRDVVFDETHLDVNEDPGVMTLARGYGLHGLLAGLLVLTALFIWKNAVSFVPPYDATTDATATGKDSAAGFVNLLRRSIPASRVLSVCVEEWKRSKPRRMKNLDRINAVVESQEALPAWQRDPVGSYRTITTILKERK